MKPINSANEPSDLFNPDGIHHINLLEFVAVTINLFIAIKMLLHLPHPPTGFVLELIADNTSALAWLKFAATTENLSVCALARLTSCLVMHASNHLISLQCSHISGPANVEADCLSRLLPTGFVPSWDYVIAQCSRLIPSQVCLLPSKLISSLAELTASPSTAVRFDELAKRLLTLKVDTSLTISQVEGWTSAIWPRP
jgi:hypothetical protein